MQSSSPCTVLCNVLDRTVIGHLHKKVWQSEICLQAKCVRRSIESGSKQAFPTHRCGGLKSLNSRGPTCITDPALISREQSAATHEKNQQGSGRDGVGVQGPWVLWYRGPALRQAANSPVYVYICCKHTLLRQGLWIPFRNRQHWQ